MGAAFAQTAPNPATTALAADTSAATTSNSAPENIVVTGSRIKSSNATAESPIVVVTAAEIAHTQSETLEDVLQKLPELGTSGIYSTTNNGGGGVSCVELRNLGIERTLVLVDGKRFVQGNSSCVDLNNIPIDMVERIEILKDGASTTYGADAIAGVINIILKHNFSGVTFHANGNIGTDAGDDKTGELSVLAGTNFDKGNFTIGAEYENQGSVVQKDRDWAQNPIQTDGPLGSGPAVTGSFYNPNGIVFPDGNASDPATINLAGVGGGTLVNKNGTLGAIYEGLNSQRFNFGALQQLQDSLEKESFNSSVNYDFNDNVTGFLQTFYTHKHTGEQLAPQPVNGGLPPYAGVPDAYVIPEGNPYLTGLGVTGPVDLYKRETQFGDRQYNQYDNTFQINGGFKGNLGAGWDYEVFFQYGEEDEQITNTNNINFFHLEQEAGFQSDPTAAGAAGAGDPTTFGIYNPGVCSAAVGCVLSNPFGQNFSAAAIKYATYTEAQQTRYTLKIYGGNVSNSELFELPAGPVGVSLGAEHRAETGEFTPDSLDLTGQGLGSTAQPTKGGFDVTEVYGEARVPLLKDLPGVKDLHIDLGGRFFAYNNFGTGETWKVSGNYTPIAGIRIRGSDGVAFRQPSVNDLFTGNAISFNGANDPCAQPASYGSKAATVTANCLKQGVNPANFTQIGSQVQTVVGGNPNLNPETARTQTLGLILSSPILPPRATITLDYFRTKIDNTISTLPDQFILDSCYTSANFQPGTNGNNFCQLVLPRLATGQLSEVISTNQNLGVTRTEGLDIGANYSYSIPGYGTISLQNDATVTFKFQQQNLPNGPFIGLLGTIGVEAASLPAYPRVRDNISLNWHIANYTFGYELRYLEGTTFSTDPAPFVQGKLGTQYSSAKTPDVEYHDIFASYDYSNASVTVGIQNLFDKAPPYVFDTATNTDAAVYDILGRVVYVKTTLRF